MPRLQHAVAAEASAGALALGLAAARSRSCAEDRLVPSAKTMAVSFALGAGKSLKTMESPLSSRMIAILLCGSVDIRLLTVVTNVKAATSASVAGELDDVLARLEIPDQVDAVALLVEIRVAPVVAVEVVSDGHAQGAVGPFEMAAVLPPTMTSSPPSPCISSLPRPP